MCFHVEVHPLKTEVSVLFCCRFFSSLNRFVYIPDQQYFNIRTLLAKKIEARGVSYVTKTLFQCYIEMYTEHSVIAEVFRVFGRNSWEYFVYSYFVYKIDRMMLN